MSNTIWRTAPISVEKLLDVYSGQRARFERSDILGVIAPEDLPKWAKHYLELRQAEKERNSRDREGR